jgi:hypothetical protein
VDLSGRVFARRARKDGWNVCAGRGVVGGVPLTSGVSLSVVVPALNARGDVLIFLDADVRLEKEFLEGFLTEFGNR